MGDGSALSEGTLGSVERTIVGVATAGDSESDQRRGDSDEREPPG